MNESRNEHKCLLDAIGYVFIADETFFFFFFLAHIIIIDGDGGNQSDTRIRLWIRFTQANVPYRVAGAVISQTGQSHEKLHVTVAVAAILSLHHLCRDSVFSAIMHSSSSIGRVLISVRLARIVILIYCRRNNHPEPHPAHHHLCRGHLVFFSLSYSLVHRRDSHFISDFFFVFSLHIIII